MLFFLIDNEFAQNKAAISVESPFFQNGSALSVRFLYKKNNLIFFEKQLQRLNQAAQQLNLPFNGELVNEKKILQLIEKNNLSNNAALIKIICALDIDGCRHYIFAFPYNPGYTDVIGIIHPYPVTSPMRKFPLLFSEDHVWQDFYTQKLAPGQYPTSFFQTFITNNKQQIISSLQGDIIAIWNKNLYFVHRRQPYYEYEIQNFIIKNAHKFGIKKVLDKNKGFAQKFLQNADEIIFINDLLDILPVKAYFNQNQNLILLKQKGWAKKISGFVDEKLFKNKNTKL